MQLNQGHYAAFPELLYEDDATLLAKKPAFLDPQLFGTKGLAACLH